MTGSSVTGEGTAGTSVTGENVTGESMTGEGTAGTSVTGESMIGEGTAGPNVTGEGMAGPSVTAPVVAPVKDPVDETRRRPDLPWKVVVLDDPVNLMSYVTYVFRKLFGYSRQKAHRLMLQVHNEGKAVVASGPKEKAEFDVYRLHEHGLWAVLEQD